MSIIAKSLKYPFSQEARMTSMKYARDLGVLADFLEQPENAFIVDAAENRVFLALSEPAVELPRMRDEREVLIYPTARLIVEEIGNPRLRARQATAEAEAVNNSISKESSPFITDLCRSSFGWDVKSAGRLEDQTKLPIEIRTYDMKIRFENFLEVAPDFHAEEWKLVNRFVQDGWVLIKRSQLDRLVSGRFKQIILSGRFDIPRLPERVIAAVQRIEDTMKVHIRQVEPFKIDGQVNSAFPPCIKKMYTDSVSGQVNLSHDARFALASFLIRIGMSQADVNEVFVHSPDSIRSNVREYQIKHIAEKRSDSEIQGYYPTGCKKLRTNNLCPVAAGETFDPLCEYILNPLSFYRTRAWEILKDVPNHSWYAEKKDKKQSF